MIDYKSDIVTPEDYISKGKEFDISMIVYVKAAEQLSRGIKVMGWLYFTEINVFYKMGNK